MRNTRRGRGDAPPRRRPTGVGAAIVAASLLLAGCGSAPSSSGPVGSGSYPTSASDGPGWSPAPVAPPSPTTDAAGATVPVIVDTDLDADDLRALIYVAARPDVDLVAVTVAGTGIVHCPAGVRIARAALARVGRAGVPVACGRATPLSGSAAFPAEWRTRADAAHGLDLSSVPATPGAPMATAVELLTAAILAAPVPVRLIVLGPATNVAEALAARPGLASRIGPVTMMGGAVGAPGNVAGVGVADDNISAEWNVFADPAAWQAVLDAGLHPTMVTLDATAAVPVTEAAFLALSANRDAPAARLVFDLFDADPSLLMTQQSFWDSLAAVAAFEPEVLTTRQATVRIVQAPGPELGRLIDDRAGAPAAIATTADARAFQAEFLSVLNGRAPVRPVPDPDVTLAIRFDGTTCQGDIPAAIRQGYVAVRFDNRSATPAMAGLLALADGVTAEDLRAALAADPGSAATKLDRSIAGVSAEPGSGGDGLGVATRPGNAFVGCLTFDPKPRLSIAGSLTIGP